MKFVTIKTITPYTEDKRNVTLAWSEKTRTVSLLGNLLHNTTVVVDQALVNELQSLVNEINKQ